MVKWDKSPSDGSVKGCLWFSTQRSFGKAIPSSSLIIKNPLLDSFFFVFINWKMQKFFCFPSLLYLMLWVFCATPRGIACPSTNSFSKVSYFWCCCRMTLLPSPTFYCINGKEKRREKVRKRKGSILCHRFAQRWISELVLSLAASPVLLLMKSHLPQETFAASVGRWPTSKFIHLVNHLFQSVPSWVKYMFLHEYCM